MQIPIWHVKLGHDFGINPSKSSILSSFGTAQENNNNERIFGLIIRLTAQLGWFATILSLFSLSMNLTG